MTTEFTPAELTIIARALDFTAVESTLEECRSITSDLSCAPLVRIARRVREVRDAS